MLNLSCLLCYVELFDCCQIFAIEITNLKSTQISAWLVQIDLEQVKAESQNTESQKHVMKGNFLREVSWTWIWTPLCITWVITLNEASYSI